MRKRLTYLLDKLPSNILRTAIIAYAVISSALLEFWHVAQIQLWNKDCADRPKYDASFSWTLFAFWISIFALPIVLVKLRKNLILFVWLEAVFLSISNLASVLTAHDEDWECYTMGGSTDFGDDYTMTLLLAVSFTGLLTLCGAFDFIRFYFLKFYKRNENNLD